MDFDAFALRASSRPHRRETGSGGAETGAGTHGAPAAGQRAGKQNGLRFLASRIYFDPVAAAREVGVENPEAFEA